ncbi:hypothetical protein GCM10010377_68950 [Streptomyces viridiviolaceus]|uniref:Type VII secretion system-associated protein n=1 Tax=Streptomyces viridiviolaceus TaxID=68282 RepID=A0ABW2E846_9ACTN|nr:type VII secretion system-associated protein [Streptomyces viridiviolaceus]GHB68344.1 hypothetical protein GCM10010377_68950 [Streptomyces viridiviolaceus]
MSDDTRASTTAQDEHVMPEPPEDVREAARHAPDHWFGLVDPAWREGSPPAWAVLGQWRSDTSGEIVAWQPNDDYRPSPAALGWDPPTDPVDDAVQRAATGYARAEEVTRALAEAELAVLARSDGGLVTAATPDGTAVVPVFTAQPHLETAGMLAYEVVPCADLVDRLPVGHMLYLNPGGAAPMTVRTEPLLAILQDSPAAS